MKRFPCILFAAGLAGLSSCSSGPESMTEAQYLRVLRFQLDLGEAWSVEESELFTAQKLGDLPEGVSLTTVDLRGKTGLGFRESDQGIEPLVVVFAKDTGLRGVPVVTAPEPPDPWTLGPWCFAAEGATPFLAGAGTLLGDFDSITAVSQTRSDGVTFVGSRFGRQVIAFGGEVREGPFFDETAPLSLSRDGLWIAFRGAGDMPASDRVGPARRVEESSILPLAGDQVGEVMLFGGERGGWSATSVRDGLFDLVVEGMRVGRYEEVQPPVQGLGGATAWPVRDEDGMRYVIGRSPQPAFDQVGRGSFALRGSQFAFVGRDEENDHVVVGGEIRDSFPLETVEKVAVSNDGSTWAAVVRDRDGHLAVRLGNRELGRYPAVDDLRVVGEHAVYAAEVDGQRYLYVDGRQLSGPWDWIGGRAVNGEGTQIGLVAGRGREVHRDAVELD